MVIRLIEANGTDVPYAVEMTTVPLIGLSLFLFSIAMPEPMWRRQYVIYGLLCIAFAAISLTAPLISNIFIVVMLVIFVFLEICPTKISKAINNFENDLAIKYNTILKVLGLQSPSANFYSKVNLYSLAENNQDFELVDKIFQELQQFKSNIPEEELIAFDVLEISAFNSKLEWSKSLEKYENQKFYNSRNDNICLCAYMQAFAEAGNKEKAFEIMERIERDVLAELDSAVLLALIIPIISAFGDLDTLNNCFKTIKDSEFNLVDFQRSYYSARANIAVGKFDAAKALLQKASEEILKSEDSTARKAQFQTNIKYAQKLISDNSARRSQDKDIFDLSEFWNSIKKS